MKFFLNFLSFLMLANTSQVQIQSVVSSYDLRFDDKQIDYCTPTPTLCTQIQIKAADGAEDFLVGSHTIFVNYNTNAISLNSYNSLNFNEETICIVIEDVFDYNPYLFSFDDNNENDDIGNWSLNTLLDAFFDGFECPIVSNEWQKFGTLCFDIIDETQNTDLSFNLQYTLINNGDETSTHNPNNVETFSEKPMQNAHFSVLLEGSYESTTNTMSTNLRNDGLLPILQPFNRPPWNYDGSESLFSTNDFPTDVVDWVLVEARDIDDNSIVLETKAAFLLANGEILDTDPSICKGIKFDEIEEYLPYYFSIKTRNHLAVLSETEIFYPNEMVYSFSNPANVNGGTTQLKDIGNGVFALKAGDVNSDGRININDINSYYDESAALNMYLDSDVNFNGTTSVADFNLFPNEAVIGAVQLRY